ncbi:hypothetical protein VKT23_020586 [Stygiomarasmius scandens]|uniref:Uncharacterized protein n=1 Tax=Marasmiellus scandens TaxID=2682957 RepID=A0ABR1IL61_9AGAR
MTTTLTSTAPHPQEPIPYLFGMALTFEQLNMLASHYLGDNFVQNICLGDPAYAFERTWEANGIDNVIVEIPGKDSALRKSEIRTCNEDMVQIRKARYLEEGIGGQYNMAWQPRATRTGVALPEDVSHNPGYEERI